MTQEEVKIAASEALKSTNEAMPESLQTTEKVKKTPQKRTTKTAAKTESVPSMTLSDDTGVTGAEAVAIAEAMETALAKDADKVAAAKKAVMPKATATAKKTSASAAGKTTASKPKTDGEEVRKPTAAKKTASGSVTKPTAKKPTDEQP